MFIDAQPTDSEREVYLLAEQALIDANDILKDLQTYKGAAGEIRLVSFVFPFISFVNFPDLAESHVYFFLFITKLTLFPVLNCYRLFAYNQHPQFRIPRFPFALSPLSHGTSFLR